MVAMYGMSEVVGLAHCAQRQNPFAAGMPDGFLQRDCSEQTAREIDQEVKKLLAEAYAHAKTILHDHRRQLDLVAGELLERETLDGKSFQRLLQEQGSHPNQPTTSGATV
jgi:cell division protease FtsH